MTVYTDMAEKIDDRLVLDPAVVTEIVDATPDEATMEVLTGDDNEFDIHSEDLKRVKTNFTAQSPE